MTTNMIQIDGAVIRRTERAVLIEINPTREIGKQIQFWCPLRSCVLFGGGQVTAIEAWVAESKHLAL